MLAWDIALRTPLLRAGMGGQIAGLDVAVALKLAKAENADLAIMSRLFAAISDGFLAGASRG